MSKEKKENNKIAYSNVASSLDEYNKKNPATIEATLKRLTDRVNKKTIPEEQIER